jgi:hypothetical protein
LSEGCLAEEGVTFKPRTAKERLVHEDDTVEASVIGKLAF